MGKGDKKTKRGKLFKGSHGISNPRKRVKNVVPIKVKPEAKAEEAPKSKEKKVVKKKE